MMIEEEIKKHTWYHSIDLGGGVVTPGRFKNVNLEPVMKLLDQMSFQGADCLDIGTMDGKIAFELEKRGARTVTATCLTEHATVRLLKEYFKSDLRYLPGVSLKMMASREDFTPAKFDLIVFSGVLYHLMDPLAAIAIVRNMLKGNGVVLLETGVAHFENGALDDEVLMAFNHDGRFLPGFENLWFPTPACVRYMLSYCFLKPLGHAIATEGCTPRYAVAARAVSAGQIDSSDYWLRLVHYIGGSYEPLEPKRYEQQASDECVVKMPDALPDLRAREPLDRSNPKGHSREQHRRMAELAKLLSRAGERGHDEVLVYHPWEERTVLGPVLPRAFKFRVTVKGIVTTDSAASIPYLYGLPLMVPAEAKADSRPIVALPDHFGDLEEVGLGDRVLDL